METYVTLIVLTVASATTALVSTIFLFKNHMIHITESFLLFLCYFQICFNK